MKHIKFKYMDALSNGQWNEQECIVNSIQECKEIYGLGVDCDFQIISVEDC